MEITPEMVESFREVLEEHLHVDWFSQVDAKDVEVIIRDLAKREPFLSLIREAERAAVLLPLLTVRQVIDAGDRAIDAAGLNPWCINEGRATGHERIDNCSLKHALEPLTQQDNT